MCLVCLCQDAVIMGTTSDDDLVEFSIQRNIQHETTEYCDRRPDIATGHSKILFYIYTLCQTVNVFLHVCMNSSL